MTNPAARPEPGPKFTRQEAIDSAGIVGARWWQEGISAHVPRRQAMTALLAIGGAIVGIGAIGAVVATASRSPEVSFAPRSALDMQREFGWDFGAQGEALVFDGTSTQPFDRGALSRLAEELAPASARLTPYYVPTLFQSPTALPKSTPSGETSESVFRRLSEVLTPIATPAMMRAYKQGEAFAQIVAGEPRASTAAFVVDLPGPESVAFAAGASNKLEPIFLFDNWPHPRGVVPAHLTLAAAAYYQPRFASTRATRSANARPLFALDRRRLASYTDDASQFDNRHTARLPSAANLKALGVTTIVYVSPNAIDRFELDDLADDFLDFKQAGTSLFVMPVTAIEGAAPDDARLYYGGSRLRELEFAAHWSRTSPGDSSNELQPYVPSPRATPYSSGTASSARTTRTRPTGFGMVPVAIAVGTGVVLGAKMSRSGSWNRTNYGSSAS